MFFFLKKKNLFLDAEQQRKEKEILKRNLAQKRNRSPPNGKEGNYMEAEKAK